ncbi:MAG: translation initiation factor eIF-1A [archaeon]
MGKKEREADAKQQALAEEIRRVHLPRGIQVLGLLDRRLGGSRCSIRCMDGKTRVCRIPGRLKRSLWVREGDIVLVEPWELAKDDKGDIIFKYTRGQVELLKRRGLLAKLDEFDKF